MGELERVTNYLATKEYIEKIEEIVGAYSKLLEELYLRTMPQKASWREPLIRVMDKYFHSFWSSLKTTEGRTAFAEAVSGDIAAGLTNLGYTATVETRPSRSFDMTIVAAKE